MPWGQRKLQNLRPVQLSLRLRVFDSFHSLGIPSDFIELT